MVRVAARPIAAFVIDLHTAPELPAPEPFEHNAMHLARFPADRDVLIAFTIIPSLHDPTAVADLTDLFENALDDIAFMHHPIPIT